MLPDYALTNLDNYQLWQLSKYVNILKDTTTHFPEEPSERLSTAEDNYIYSLSSPPQS